MIIEVKVPSPGESVTEVVIETWLKNDGDFVQRDEAIADIQTDKAMLSLYAEETGKLSIKLPAGETVAVGAIAATIDTSAAPAAGASAPAAAAETKTAETAATAAKNETTYATGHPSPSASHILAEKGVNPADVAGTGRDGRITKEDAQKAQPAAKVTATATPAKTPAAAPAPAGNYSRELRREKMTLLRKTLSQRLVSVKNDTAMLTTFNEADMTAIKEIRAKYKDGFSKKHGINIGFMSFFAKACALALMEFPAVNAQIDGEEIVYYDYVDMGIAVSTDRGLMVPVIRNVESMSLAEIERAIAAMAEKARQNKISIADMQGGTFTITNGGVFGSLMSTPILNPPQSAILGMHAIKDRPMGVDGKIELRPMMYLALSYDHRIIDGKESVSYLVKVKDYLEDPVRLLLGV